MSASSISVSVSDMRRRNSQRHAVDDSVVKPERRDRYPSGNDQLSLHSNSDPPPFQARLWSKDPVTTEKRKGYFKVLAGGTFLITLVIFGVLSIFWGALYDVPNHVHNLEGWVIDFDGGVIGQAVVQAFQNSTGSPQQITWHVVNASEFPNFPDDVVNALVDEKAWAAVTVNPSASSNLTAAVASADSSYNGSRAVTAYVAEARNERAYASFLLPQVTKMLSTASQKFSLMYARQLAANSSVNVTALATQAPNLLSAPLYYTTANVRPFDVPVAQAVVFIGLIFLLILSFIICMMSYTARVTTSGLERHLKLSSLILMRISVPIVLDFILSLFFSLLSLAFQAPFDRYYGDSGFVIYWMMNWMGMCALGFAMESLITVLTPAFTPLFLVLWIIANVSVSSVPIEVLPGVYRYGYAAPFYNIAQTARAILFDTRNQIGLNFGVQFAWIGVSFVTMTLLTILMRKREERAWMRQQ